MAIIGIDFGLKNSRICTYKDEETTIIPNQLGRLSTPSIVNITPEGYILVGDIAKDKLIVDEYNTASNFKQYLGTDHEFILQNKPYKAFELVAFVLNQLKCDAQNFLNEEVTTVTMSVPLYFTAKQRTDLKKAVSLAGLNVEYFINDPCAAALSFIDSKISQNKFLLIDFGGTFNATIVDFYRDLIEVISHSNDLTIGGDAIDKAILDYFIAETDSDDLTCDELILLRKQTDLVKRYLDYTMTSDTCSLTFNKEILMEICLPIFKKARFSISKALDLATMNPREIHDIVLVGGLGKFELFTDYLEELFNKEPLTFNDTQILVVNGVTLHYALKEEDILEIRLTDLCPCSYGISVKNVNNQPDITHIIIGKNMTLPMLNNRIFKTIKPYQDKIAFKICKGDNYYTKDNDVIDIIELDIPDNKLDESNFNISFYYSIDGILKVEVSDNQKVLFSKIILEEDLSATQEELAQKIEKLENINNTSLNIKIENLTQRLNVLYSNSDLSKKNNIGQTFSLLESITNTRRINQIARNLNIVEEKVDFWERSIIDSENDSFNTNLHTSFFDELDSLFSEFPFDDDNQFFGWDDVDDIDDIDEFDFINFDLTDEFDDSDDFDFY